MNKRVVFPKGFQSKFIKNIKEKTGLSWKELANKLSVNEGSLSKAYRFELCNIPYDLFTKMIGLIKENEENLIKTSNLKVIEEKVIIGRRVFGEQKKMFGPINIKFKNKNLLLDISKVRFSKYDLSKEIKLPLKLTPDLAEEIGMQFGDGFLSSRRYDYRLKGNPNNEKEYYLDYIKPLFKKLYNCDLKIKDFKTSFGFELYSQAVWEFKTKALGIKPGVKYNLFIPNKLKVNNMGILSAFIRGLFDTDGSISFKSKYGYEKYYPTIEISLTSKKVIKDVAEILSMMGFKPWVGFNKKYGRISLYGIGAFKRYKELIGWSSQKNLNKVNDWKERYPKLIK
ncbi:hypothetical protein HYT23_01490 [Candidatus Pacearchaeota archaeon]|nr:hypothetical protein [Candidatus Pacearchaeota archaeon]